MNTFNIALSLFVVLALIFIIYTLLKIYNKIMKK